MGSRKVLGVGLVVTGLLVVGCSIPLQLGLIEPNYAYGVRFSQAFESSQHWYRLNRFGGTALAIWGVTAVVAGSLLLSRVQIPRKIALALGLLYPLTIVVPVLVTYLYALSL